MRGVKRMKRVSAASIFEFWDRYGVVVAALLIVLASALAVAIRLQPYEHLLAYGIPAKYPLSVLYEMDPYINYWLVDYLVKHGFLAWDTLTRHNPATCLFWYPWCRDIAHSELPGHIYTLYVLYEFVKPFGVKLADFLAVMPAILGGILVIGVALMVYEISGSLLAAIVSAFAMAGTFIDRTMAGFIVKYSFGLAVAPYAIWLHVRALKRRSLVLFVIAGLFLAYTATVWAGFGLTWIAICASMILAPLIIKNVDALTDRRLLLGLFIEALIPTVLDTFIPVYATHRFLGFIVYRVGGMLIASYVLMLIGIALRKNLRGVLAGAVYSCIVAAIIGGAAALVAMGVVHVAGKAALALGIPVKGLPRTVAEYQPPPKGSQAYNEIMYVVLVGVFIGLPTAFLERDAWKRLYLLSAFVWAILASYASLHIAYFAYYETVVLVAYLGSVAGVLLQRAKPEIIKRGTYVRIKLGFYGVIALLLFVPAIAPSVYVAATTFGDYSYQLTTITTAEGSTVVVVHGKPYPIPTTAWLSTLYYIRTHVPKNVPVAAWWDYGYWISVVGDRPSLADGSTINGTQIKMLAKFFSSPIDKAVKYLKNFGLCKVRDFYVLVYGTVYAEVLGNKVFISTPLYVGTIPMTLGDLPKFIAAILYIAKGIDPISDIMNGHYSVVKAIDGFEIVKDPNGWVEALIRPGALPTGAPQILLVFPDWQDYAKRKPTLPTLYIYGAYKALQKLYPGKSIEIANSIFLPVRGGVMALYQESALKLLGVVSPTEFKQPYFHLVYAGVSQPIRMGGPVYKYVVVLLYRIDPAVVNALCG